MGDASAGLGESLQDFDEDGMQTFIRNHMTQILQPVAEHIQDLRVQYQNLSEDVSNLSAQLEGVSNGDFKVQMKILTDRIAQVSEATDQNKIQVAKYSEDGHHLRASLTRLEDRTDKMQHDTSSVLGMLQEHKKSITGNASTTKGVLAETDQRIQSAVSSICALAGKLAALDPVLQDLRQEFRTGLAETKDDIKSQSADISRLTDVYEGLNDRHMDAVKDLTDSLTKLGARGETSGKNIDGIKLELKQKADDDLLSFSKIQEQVDLIEKLLGDTQRNVQKMEDRVLDSTASSDAIKKEVRETSRSGTLKIAELEQQILGIQTSHHSACKAQIEAVGACRDQLEYLRESFTERVGCCQKMIGDEKAQLLDRIGELASRVDAIPTDVTQLRELCAKEDSAIASLQEEQQKMAKRADVLLRSLREEAAEFRSTRGKLEARLELNESKLEANSLEIRTKADMHKTCVELEAATSDLRKLKQDQEAVTALLEKLGSRHDQTSRLITGMSKGFQDVSLGSLLAAPGDPPVVGPKIRPQSAMASRRTPRTYAPEQ